MYIVVQDYFIKKCGLSGNKLLIFAMVYGFSFDKKSSFKGSYSFISSFLGIDEKTAKRVLKSLEKDGFIEQTKQGNSNGESGEWKVGAKCLIGGDKMSNKGGQNVQQRGGKMPTNNNSNININNNNIKREEKENINSIYSYYIKNIDVEKKYHYSSISKKWIGEILKEETITSLLSIIKNYFRQVERKWRKSPKYFFNRSKRSESYLYYLDFKQEQKTPLDKKNEKNIGF